ncbi:MAG: PspC domain-containing protein [Thermoleophilaceae bacterium]
MSSREVTPAGRGGLVRPRRGKMIAGVCAAIARRFGLSASLVRFLFLVSCILPGPQFVIYLAGWILIPRER